MCDSPHSIQIHFQSKLTFGCPFQSTVNTEVFMVCYSLDVCNFESLDLLILWHACPLQRNHDINLLFNIGSCCFNWKKSFTWLNFVLDCLHYQVLLVYYPHFSSFKLLKIGLTVINCSFSALLILHRYSSLLLNDRISLLLPLVGA